MMLWEATTGTGEQASHGLAANPTGYDAV